MEEVLNTEVTETKAKVEDIESNPTTEKMDESKVAEYVAPTEEEYKKAIQSASSKAKFELLKEFGVKSVDDFKAKQTQYDEAIKASDELKKSEVTYKEQIAKLQEELVLSSAQVSEDFKEDVLTLAKSKVNDTVDLKTAVDEILKKNPNWRHTGNEGIKVGVDKAEVAPTEHVPEQLKKKYPWLH